MREEKHATSVAIQDSGIIILGSSGSGKSDLALRLIDAGATLISDDLTVCKKVRNDIFLYCKKKICGKIEVRGMGIFTVPFVEEIKLNKKVIEEVWENYGSKSSFKGWYLSQECNKNISGIIDIYADLGNYCKKISNNLPVFDVLFSITSFRLLYVIIREN